MVQDKGAFFRPLRMIITIPVSILLLVILFLSAMFHSNITLDPGDIEDLSYERISGRVIKSDEAIALLTWNLGYAGLGKESTFFYDGKGKACCSRPPKNS